MIDSVSLSVWIGAARLLATTPIRFDVQDCCFYCSSPVSVGFVEMDHFPIPQNSGGTATVTACIGCHDMKDRKPLRKWPMSWISLAFRDREAFEAIGSGVERMEADEVARGLRDRWSVMGREARILIAKVLRVAVERAATGRDCIVEASR